MNIYKIAIVEDEKKYRDTLKTNFNKYSNEHKISFSIDEFTDGYDFIDNYQCQYNLIFLDIELKQLDGMKTAEMIRERDHKVIIIFVTNLVNFAVKGYEVDAQSFLIKPVTYFKFSREVHRALNKIDQQNNHHIILNTESGIKKIESSQILFIESVKHELIISTFQRNYSLWGTLKEWESKLENQHFYRCNNSYIVNLEHVKGVDGDYVIVNQTRLKISRARKKNFMDVLTEYFKGGI